MTFYNPNIQAAFDADEREFILLRDVELARYVLVFRIREGCCISGADELRALYQLEFVKLADNVQQENLRYLKEGFAAIIADITLEVLTGRVSSFEEYLMQKLMLRTEKDRNEVLYIGDSIQDFIELLVYSDISGKKMSSGERDFTRIFGATDESGGYPVFYSLFDRLKLYARLRKEIKLEIDRDAIEINGREVRIELRLSV